MTSEADFASQFNVPRGTMDQLQIYANLLVEWQDRMNLVGPATLPLMWDRHFADSAQLLSRGQPGSWIDMGAGAGFPGLVLALLGARPVHLVEATTKKCAFLNQVIADTAISGAIVHNDRLESMLGFPVANITARACASLAKLFDWGGKFADSSSRWVLPKGSSVELELAEADRDFLFEYELFESQTDPRGRIVVARNVRRRR